MQFCYSRASRRVARTLFSGCLLALSLSVAPALPAPPQPAPAKIAPQSQPKEEWMGTYMGARKIGYTSVITTPITYQGQPATDAHSRGVTKFSLFGSSVEQNEDSETISDAKSRPLKQIMDVTSNGSALHVEATYNYAEKKIHCRIGTGPNATEKTIAIPPG